MVHVLQELNGHANDPFLLKGLGADLVEARFHPLHQKIGRLILDVAKPLQFHRILLRCAITCR